MVLIFGPHVSLQGTADKFVNAVHDLHQMHANAIQIFTKSPMTTRYNSKFDDKVFTKAVAECIKGYKMFVVVHSSYLLNFCKDYTKQHWAMQSVIEDLKIVEKISTNPSKTGAIVHMGKNIGNKSVLECMHNFRESLKYILDKTGTLTCNVILETSCKSKNDIFWSIDSMAMLYHSMDPVYKRRIKFCVDTCHVYVSGYDVSTKAGMNKYFNEFNEAIGIQNLIVIHLNDTHSKLGSGLDRHAPVGTNNILNVGSLKAIKNLAIKNNIPMIAEAHTPFEPEYKFVKKT